MNDTKNVISIDTGKPLKEKAKTGQDAKRWKMLIEYLKDGFATLTIAGTVLEKNELDGLISHLDDKIKQTDMEQRRLKMQRRRKNK